LHEPKSNFVELTEQIIDAINFVYVHEGKDLAAFLLA